RLPPRLLSARRLPPRHSPPPPQREGGREAAEDLVEVEAARPEVARDDSVVLRAPRPEPGGVDRLDLKDESQHVRGPQEPGRDPESAEVGGAEGARVEGEERRQQNEVEVQVAGRQSRPRRVG